MKTPTYRSKMPERTVISISKLNRKVKQLIEGGFYAAEDQKRFGAANLKLALSMK